MDVVKPENREQMIDVARAIDEQDTDAVMIVGGDGTLSDVSWCILNVSKEVNLYRSLLACSCRRRVRHKRR